jgi:ABC-type sugar transport system ATPase subunit
VTDRLHGIDLDLRQGEIFGLAGLVGSGRTELARCIFGADPRRAGTIALDGAVVDIRSPTDACVAGIALIPEDRRGHALVPMMDVEQNFGLPNAAFYRRGGFLRRALRRREALAYCDELSIRPKRTRLPIRSLSGGNQQKVVIARWLRSSARVLLFDEPTRGIDVGAKAEIHAILRRLAAEGRTVLMISSELPELLALSHRIGVMRDGRLAGVLDNTPDLGEDMLMQLAAGARFA